MNTSLSTLEKLKKQRAALDARIQATEARTRVTERKQDTRRKILVGAYYLEEAQKKNQWPALQQILSDYLTRDSDRKLFDLPPLNTIKKSETTPA